ncbi:EthD domain-containing protein [Caballeronia sp. TF1N1]|uniref:EthD domain-containing protein n=1 Tax=Caballeronia sp. TF1N1 TaxID=2878153 RepID=UPI001FD5A06D|nr:EthD domain-containing protein [Caballeronia sp. TF1N1]
MDTIQKFSLLKRRPDLTREQFNEHWHTVHGPLLASIPAYWKRRCQLAECKPAR